MTDLDTTRLPAKQQIGLYVVLTKFKGDNPLFHSSDFSREMKSFLSTSEDNEYQKIIGGILGGLSRGQLLKKVSGDRDPLWLIPEDIHKNAELYKKELFPVATYWQK